jgi:hypothetical protein
MSIDKKKNCYNSTGSTWCASEYVQLFDMGLEGLENLLIE